MSDEQAQDQLTRYAQALDDLIKLGDYLWRQGGYVPARGVSRKIRDVMKQALGEDDARHDSDQQARSDPPA